MSEHVERPRRLLEGGGSAGDALAADVVTRLSEPPPTDRVAQERIWRTVASGLEVHARRRARARWLWVPASALASVASVLLLQRLQQQPKAIGDSPRATIRVAAGKVLHAAPRQDWTKSESGEVLRETSRVHTDDGHATLALSKSQVLVSERTEMGLEALGQNTFLRLSQGSIVCDVEPRKPGETYVVQTTRYRVEVKGTIFAVRERAPDDVEVSVSRGLVEVTGEGGTWRVPAGSAWRSRTPETALKDDITSEERSSVGEERADAVTPRPPTESAAEPEPKRTEQRPRAVAPRAVPEEAVARLEKEDVRPQPQQQLPTPAPVAPPPPVLAQDPYEAALSVARNGDPLNASDALQRVFDGHGAHADLALYELGRLRQQRLADPLGALGAYQTYERTYPHGALLQEVRLSAIEIQLQQENLVGAMAEIDAFLGAFGKSERAPEVHLLRGDVLRQREDAEGALREYRIAAERGTGEVAQEGLYRSAACAEKTGDIDGARDALREYLKRYPTGRHAHEAAAALGGR